ncbi:HK97 family phage prohead protease [Paracoccus sp. (in: a-proteobacteria)]|uniref:HK97 family phage prohead protease n=1 Tax=Paracoccus sp. TaxID=267 RepID=UPI002897DAA7|nr:HK97 family phage prohead protease [Paracoccus sp. (in: a-proteobacteria)]
MSSTVGGLELKFLPVRGNGAQGIRTDGTSIEGYASLFGLSDQGGDTVRAGAFAASLARLRQKGERVRMLWQHDPTRPIGVWDEIHEDAKGLWVKGRLLPEVAQAREAAALIAAGAIDGLSIGYRTVSAERAGIEGADKSRAVKGRRILTELDLWEVSLVTFPMLPDARVGRKSEDSIALAQAFHVATRALRAG